MQYSYTNRSLYVYMFLACLLPPCSDPETYPQTDTMQYCTVYSYTNRSLYFYMFLAWLLVNNHKRTRIFIYLINTYVKVHCLYRSTHICLPNKNCAKCASLLRFVKCVCFLLTPLPQAKIVFREFCKLANMSIFAKKSKNQPPKYPARKAIQISAIEHEM